MDEIILTAIAARYALAECPEWRGLVRLLDLSEGFVFVPLIVPDAVGAEVCRRELVKHLAAKGKSLVEIALHPGKSDDSPLRPLLDAAIPDDAGAIWVAPAPDLWEEDASYDPDRTQRFEEILWPNFCNHANQAREVVRHRLTLPFVLVGSEILRTNLRRHAPDLWSIRDVLVIPEPRQSTRGLVALRNLDLLPFETPPATGDLAETLHEVQRIARDHPQSPALPVLLKRAARIEIDSFQWDAAEEHLSQALQWEEENQVHFKDRIASHGLLSELFWKTANHNRGIFHAERALEIARNEFPADSPTIAIHLSNLARLLKATNHLSEAEPLMRDVLLIDRAAYGDEHPRVALDLNNLAALLQATNRLSEAEPLMREALRIARAAYGDEHPHVASHLNNLAQLLTAKNRMSEAEPLMREALRIDRAAYGDEHPDVATDLNNLASLLQATNRLSEAEPLVREALRIFRESLGPEHPNTLSAARNLELLLEEINRESPVTRKGEKKL